MKGYDAPLDLWLARVVIDRIEPELGQQGEHQLGSRLLLTRGDRQGGCDPALGVNANVKTPGTGVRDVQRREVRPADHLPLGDVAAESQCDGRRGAGAGGRSRHGFQPLQIGRRKHRSCWIEHSRREDIDLRAGQILELELMFLKRRMEHRDTILKVDFTSSVVVARYDEIIMILDPVHECLMRRVARIEDKDLLWDGSEALGLGVDDLEQIKEPSHAEEREEQPRKKTQAPAVGSFPVKHEGLTVFTGGPHSGEI